MSDRILQPVPKVGIQQATIRFKIQNPWSAVNAVLPDIHFLRTWLEYDSQVEKARPRGGVNWYAVLGLLLIVGVSAGFWIGVGMIISHFWK